MRRNIKTIVVERQTIKVFIGKDYCCFFVVGYFKDTRNDQKTNTALLTPLERAVEKVGGQTALASKISKLTGTAIKQSDVRNWINRDKKLPAEYVLAIEKVAGVSRHELRPDIYPVEQAS